MVKIAHWLLDQKTRAETLLFYLFLLFLPTQLGKHFWPNFSFVVGIRSDYLSPTLYTTDVLLLVIFVFWFYRNVGRLAKMSKKIVKKKKYILLVCLGYISFALIFWPGNRILELYGLAKYVEIGLLVLYLKNNLLSRYTLSAVVFVLGINVCIESFLAIAQFINQGSLNGVWYWLGERSFTNQTIDIAQMSLNGTLVLRPYATFSHPNILAGYMLVMSTIFLLVWQNTQDNRLQVIHKKRNHGERNLVRTMTSRMNYGNGFLTLVFFLVSSFTVFLSFSRLAIVVWLFSILCVLGNSFLKHNKIRFSLIACLLLYLCIGLFLNLPGRFSTLQLSDETVMQRTVLLQASWTLLTHYPIFGTGIYNYIPQLGSLAQFATNYYLIQPVHNIFVLCLVELGIFVGILFVLLFIFLLKQSWTNFNQSKNPFALLSFLLLLDIFLTGNGDHYWLTLQQGQLVLGLVFGIALSANKKREIRNETPAILR